ncbi:hypothetical protein HANVADRAFT_1575 [Hanseniaspora valbyensis NRRL Y-1626]|uniref:Uncharacterized protein n=1 Tax=Hanseniaspora valbyensis NRRL Y-1626 TaxID=766949 RepID=A0A1B7TG34_9ASCO|nr:hypothetical protein HANVADRAFT_1575 [Hanseniaspora valbyensis NRRL Y-1626]
MTNSLPKQTTVTETVTVPGRTITVTGIISTILPIVTNTSSDDEAIVTTTAISTLTRFLYINYYCQY